MKFSRRNITPDNIKDLKEILGISHLSISWLIGTIFSPKKFEGKPLKTPLAILIRLLYNYPEYNPVPTPPTYADIKAKLDKYLPDDWTRQHRSALMFGISSWSGYDWEAGAEPSPTINRLFLILDKMIDKEGEQGVAKFLQILDEEAKARGFRDLQEVVETQNWHKEDPEN